jgi:DDE superfamily endonuclease
MQPFRACFTAPVWEHVLVLVMGAVLAPGKRTVTAALRVMGLDAISNFTGYHQGLNRARWSSRAAARCLLGHIVATLLGDGPVVIGFDDTVERRWGPRIAARGIYRDPVRSSKEHFVKTSGRRWLCFMVLAPIPWAGRVWALPFLSILAPSERYHAERGRRHKKLTDWARQGILCVCRWLPRHRVVFVGDSSFAVLDLLAAVREYGTVISRLRLDANLFARVPQRRPTKRGRRPVKGRRLPKLKKRLADAATAWRTLTLTGWYGNETRTVAIASDVAVWYRGGSPPVTLRWVLVREPTGEREPQAFFSTDPELDPVLILTYFVRRWQVEVTFAGCRAHLGVETQRQWSDRAILRTTPALLGLYSLITVWATALFEAGAVPRGASWYAKAHLTFSDAIAAVRYRLWSPDEFSTSTGRLTSGKIPVDLAQRMADALCYAA